MRRAEFRAASSPNLSESCMAGWAPVLGFASPLELRPKPLGGFAAIMLLGLPLRPRPLWGSAPNPVGPPPQSNPVQEPLVYNPLADQNFLYNPMGITLGIMVFMSEKFQI